MEAAHCLTLASFSMLLPGLLCMACRYQLSAFQSGLVVSTSLFGALAGSAAAFVVGDKLGRKRELLLAATLYGEQESDALTGAGPAHLHLSVGACHTWEALCCLPCSQWACH